MFQLTAVGGLGIVHITAGLMLALGPFFIAFFMFDSTRSFFEGWVRVLAGAALAATGISIALGLELSFLEPWLASVLARRSGGEPLPSAPTELFVISCVFALIVGAVLLACVWLTRTFRLAPLISHWTDRAEARPPDLSQKQLLAEAASNRSGERSRARALADVLVSSQRREAISVRIAGASRAPASAPEGEHLSRSTSHPHNAVGHSFRHVRPRVSSSAGKRDSQ